MDLGSLLSTGDKNLALTRSVDSCYYSMSEVHRSRVVAIDSRLYVPAVEDVEGLPNPLAYGIGTVTLVSTMVD